MRAPIGFTVPRWNPCDVRESLRELSWSPGVVVTCVPCGASRFCVGRDMVEDAATFRHLHKGHEPPDPAPPEAA